MSKHLITFPENTGVSAESSSILIHNIGQKGFDGKSAYQIAVDNGFIGTEEDWLNNLYNGYTHTQASLSDTWVINHNLNKYPAIDLLTVGGMKFDATIVHTSLNQAIAYLAIPYTGLAQCN
jgi:hypothetical protein